MEACLECIQDVHMGAFNELISVRDMGLVEFLRKLFKYICTKDRYIDT